MPPLGDDCSKKLGEVDGLRAISEGPLKTKFRQDDNAPLIFIDSHPSRIDFKNGYK